MMPTRYLSVQEVIAINLAMIQRYSPGEHIGVKDSGLLESAFLRPQSSAFGEEAYPTISEKAEDFTVDMANHKFEFQELANIIQAHCVPDEIIRKNTEKRPL